ncbi:hypothetical protein DAPPUDRAFT_246369 [Daphnia pulex]|uniref:Uncharacterized protein n=1 Tax=Daphnia pulex TaxID=6669 RepID=E9GQB2_DAPPU|nr:hypothetical protein DAPPUDRAFT_246369 [Daphnia pulex]|eukprot:EFX78372.1 hypothetical protein DAPPUDRAFT_246369 [Daphnia pulex]
MSRAALEVVKKIPSKIKQPVACQLTPALQSGSTSASKLAAHHFAAYTIPIPFSFACAGIIIGSGLLPERSIGQPVRTDEGPTLSSSSECECIHEHVLSYSPSTSLPCHFVLDA